MFLNILVQMVQMHIKVAARFWCNVWNAQHFEHTWYKYKSNACIVVFMWLYILFIWFFWFVWEIPYKKNIYLPLSPLLILNMHVDNRMDIDTIIINLNYQIISTIQIQNILQFITYICYKINILLLITNQKHYFATFASKLYGKISIRKKYHINMYITTYNIV